jgi:hypothetical protein
MSYLEIFIKINTVVQDGNIDPSLCIALEQVHRMIIGVHLSPHRNMLVAEAFLKSLVKLYEIHPVYSGWRNIES